MHFKGLYCTLLFSVLFLYSNAQQDSIYRLAEQMPILEACQDSSNQKNCTSDRLLRFVYHNLQYPITALEDSIRGQVVIQFVIEKDGTTGPDSLLKDIGGGCGQEAQRIIELLRKAGDIWIPGSNKGDTVRTYFTLPIRFSPPKPVKTLPYTIDGQDTIYLELEKGIQFSNPRDTSMNLMTWIEQSAQYPDVPNPPCANGKIAVELLVNPDGTHKILEIIDYSSLGIDYTYEAINLIGKSQGMWIPAEYKGRPVGSALTLPIEFINEAPTCEMDKKRYQNAREVGNQANLLFVEGLIREAIHRWSLALFWEPENSEWRAARGRAFLELQDYKEACADMTQVQNQLNVTWYAQYLPMVCQLGNQSEPSAGNQEN